MVNRDNITPFKDSQEAALRRVVRSAVRQADFTKSDRDVTLALVNFWLHHRGTGKPIHPGRNKLAKKSGVTVKTVSRTFSKLRAGGVLTPVSNLHGGHRTATRYTLNLHALMTLCGCDWMDEFLRGHNTKCPGSNFKNVPVAAGQNVPRYITTSNMSLSQEQETRSGGEDNV